MILTVAEEALWQALLFSWTNLKVRKRNGNQKLAGLPYVFIALVPKATIYKQFIVQRDRFVANSLEKSIPFCATPRSRRLAKLVGEAKDRCLTFHGENLNIAIRSKEANPFHRELKRYTRSLYEIPTPKSVTSASTNLCSQPELCLGAPKLDDDFYSRATAWSSTDLLAVAMRTSVVYRDMKSHQVWKIRSFDDEQESATCLKWSPSSKLLGIGNDWGVVRVYDPKTKRCLRYFEPHHDRDFVGDFSWRDENVFTVGYQTGQLRQFDMREHNAGKIYRSHRSRICGVEWNSNSQLLAVGGGNGVLVCYDARKPESGGSLSSLLYNNIPTLPSSESGYSSSSTSYGTNPELSTLSARFRYKRHLSTVKALAWCPWAPELLATGGGTKDGAIHFWDTHQGKLLETTIYTNSQVTSLHFSPSCREIVSTHGYAFAPVESTSAATLPAPRKQSVLVHNYPRGEVTGSFFDASHGRITHSCISPDGTRIVTCGSDDSIRIYKVFGKQQPPSPKGLSLLGTPIR